MNKEEMISALAVKTGMTKISSKAALEAVLEIISHTLSSAGEVRLVGFGIFGVKERAARTGRNLADNTPMEIPAQSVPFFKPGAELKRRCSHIEKAKRKGEKK